MNVVWRPTEEALANANVVRLMGKLGFDDYRALRLQHSEAKVVVTADGSLRRGREVPMKEIVDEALRDAPSVEHVVVWRRLGRDEVPMTPGRDIWDADAMHGRPGELPALEL